MDSSAVVSPTIPPDYSYLLVALSILIVFVLLLSLVLFLTLKNLNPALLPYEESAGDLDLDSREEISPIYPTLYSATVTSWGMHKRHFAKGELVARGCPWCYEQKLHLMEGRSK